MRAAILSVILLTACNRVQTKTAVVDPDVAADTPFPWCVRGEGWIQFPDGEEELHKVVACFTQLAACEAATLKAGSTFGYLLGVRKVGDCEQATSAQATQPLRQPGLRLVDDR
jgi:hypothetical protein